MPAPRPAASSSGAHAAAARPAPAASAAPVGEAEFELDDSADESLPLIHTELVGASATAMPPANPFDDVSDYFNTFGRSPIAEGSLAHDPVPVPTTSIEIPLPPGILDSLPVLGEAAPAATVAPAPARRSTDGLVREVTIPLNLSMEEIRQHKRLRLKITLDVNLLP
jgi:hypothetical protein